ncbi:metalloregulator ArsR/SmtB family transcription factor [Fodinibius sp.]|uniref:ArsR/SmtB family transcription factor n=1 Tax=Fodinibius sp. TaxID=1872440 RepID=UPI002ACECA85|nr:metalloregulator ArsR/SmtB family transcription factor [Fodinibius sp.]MDZ7659740.1 metalloregulator ArsR/SmtB family transcription factor [Fodinibius sp.]
MDTDKLLLDEQAIQIKAKLFRGFADPSRLMLIEVLRNGKRSVGELVEITGLSQPNVSNHLRCLADCNLVKKERDGRYIYYSLSDPRITMILQKSEQLLSEVAKGVYNCTRYDSTNDLENNE